MIWQAVILGAVGCYLLKLAGMSLPRRVLDDPRVHRVGELLPVALLSALVAVQTFGRGQGVAVHGWIYGLHDGLLRDLGISVRDEAGAGVRHAAALAALDSQAGV